MTDIELHDLDLIPERTLGTPASDGLSGRLSYGWAIRPEVEEGQPAAPLCRLVIVCTFRPEALDDAGAFRSASLGLSLRAGPDGPRPIARSVEPAERAVPVRPGRTGSTKVTLGVDSGPVKVGVERSVSDAADKDEWIVRGYGALQSTPVWDFRATKRYPLVGDYPVDATIELVPGQPNVAEVRIAAEIEYRRLGIRRYRARITPDLATVTLEAGRR